MSEFVMHSAAEVGHVELGAYRSGSIKEICTVCGEICSGHHCRRCAAPLCSTHQTDASGRCTGCEMTYAALVNDRKKHPLPGGALLLSYLLAGALVLLSTYIVEQLSLAPWLLVPVALLAGFSPLFFYRYRLRRLRPRFLDETPQRRALRRLAPEKVTKTPPESPLVIAGFCLSLFFMIPLGPILSAVLVSFGMARQPRGRRVSALSIIGLVTSVLGCLLQLLAIYF